MGIDQIGVRKKILDGIHTVHKRDWEKQSLPSVNNNKKMRSVSVKYNKKMRSVSQVQQENEVSLLTEDRWQCVFLIHVDEVNINPLNQLIAKCERIEYCLLKHELKNSKIIYMYIAY